jgi:1,4-dihydroxy-2-naphthoate octaprenyltransferase
MTINTNNSKISLWVLASRPRTLPAAAAPVLVGIALAIRGGVFHIPSALACLFISLLMQVGANFANDVFDHERGSDTAARLGPTRMTASGLLSVRQMKTGMVVAFFVAGIFGLYLVWLRGWPVLLLGVLIILAAITYTGGPFPYGYYALGDLFVFLSFGLAAVCGTYYAQAGVLSAVVYWSSVPIGLLIVNILVVNNTRDISTDKDANKITLAVVLGRKVMLWEYFLCLSVAYLVPAGLFLAGMASWGGMLSLISIPLAFMTFREFSGGVGRELNSVLGKTAQLALVYAILFSLGIIIVR